MSMLLLQCTNIIRSDVTHCHGSGMKTRHCASLLCQSQQMGESGRPSGELPLGLRQITLGAGQPSNIETKGCFSLILILKYRGNSLQSLKSKGSVTCYLCPSTAGIVPARTGFGSSAPKKRNGKSQAWMQTTNQRVWENSSPWAQGRDTQVKLVVRYWWKVPWYHGKSVTQDLIKHTL